jgi:SAM-dependent methyltransferase
MGAFALTAFRTAFGDQTPDREGRARGQGRVDKGAWTRARGQRCGGNGAGTAGATLLTSMPVHTELVNIPAPRSSQYFDNWYAAMVGSPVKDEIQQRHLGLPPHLLSTSMLSWDGLAEVTARLRLAPGDTLLDLACGRGGYGLEVAARTGARLVGVDFSAEAVRQAGEQARRLGRSADFSLGDLTATGLPDACVNSVLCVDAIQFADDSKAAYRELLRVLVPGGQAVLTCWEAIDPADERVVERLRRVALGAGLMTAGFCDVEVFERPDWRRVEREMWEEAVGLNPEDDAALRSFHDEGMRSLATFTLIRRVMATGTAPG